MKTSYVFSSRLFAPHACELDESHDAYRDPGCFAEELADFIEIGLKNHDCRISLRSQEDWGIWLEVHHGRSYRLAIGCSNLDQPDDGNARHRVFVVPNQPAIRKWFRKVEVRADVEKLVASLGEVLKAEPGITGISVQNF